MQALIKELPTAQFCGTEGYHTSFPIPFKYSDGVKHVAQTYEAYWLLLDAGYMAREVIQNKDIDDDTKSFLTARLCVDEETRAGILTIEDGNKNALMTSRLSYTDFPAETFSMFIQNGVMFLPSEY